MTDPKVAVSIGDVATLIRGVTYEKAESSVEASPGKVPLLRATNISNELDFDGLVYVPQSCVAPKQYLRPGDSVIAASSGSASVVGKAARLRHEWSGTFWAFCYALRPRPEYVCPAYLGYFLQSSQYRAKVSQLAAGVNIRNLRREHLEDFEIPLPALSEQSRIALAIESHLSRVDHAVTTLQRVQRNLERYRASVLKAAVEGRLVPTEAELARAEGRSYEPASVLLARATGTGDHHQGADGLPRGWAWTTLGRLADLKGGITKGQRSRPGRVYREVPYLRVANVQRGYLDLSVMKTISSTEAEVEELRLVPGDVLFNEGGDRDKLGRGWVWKGELPECIHQNHVFRARIRSQAILPELLSWYGNTEGQRYFFDEGKHTTNLASINMSKLRGLPVRVPPYAEQVRIREAVEATLSIVDDVEATVVREASRCARLRQSILKWAFEGRLVDQDPADEPAAALLERIRAEREASAVRRHGNGPRKRRTEASA